MITKYVGYVDSYGWSKEAYIVRALFEETPKRYVLVKDQTFRDMIDRAIGYKTHFNKIENPPIFDTWQGAFDHLLRVHTARVTRVEKELVKEEALLKLVLGLEQEVPPCG